MNGLQFLACERCGTVHAEPAVIDRCRSCRADAIVDISGRVQAEPYFGVPDP